MERIRPSVGNGCSPSATPAKASRLGVPKFARLNKLKNSARNWRLLFQTRIRFPSARRDRGCEDRARAARPGPYVLIQ